MVAALTLLQLRPRAPFESAAELGRVQAAGCPQATRLRRSLVVACAERLRPEEIPRLAARLVDDLTHEVCVGQPERAPWAHTRLLVTPRPGTTDDRAREAERLAEQVLGRRIAMRCAALVELDAELDVETARGLAERLFGNPLVDHLEVLGTGAPTLELPPSIPAPVYRPDAVIVPDDEAGRAALSRRLELGLSADEWRAVVEHYASPERRLARASRQLPAAPTRAELELIAQTWSEHCMHKELDARVCIDDRDRGVQREVDSIFRSLVRGATARVEADARLQGRELGLLSVFDDNAGVVAFDEELAVVLKVETHNSPSALDPYGGAMTGVLGCQRDVLGTGRGGARLLAGTSVLCFAPLGTSAPRWPGQLPPEVIYRGVLRGVQDAGNLSGVPTVNGATCFDPRFAAKPLVYCGSLGCMPRRDAHGHDAVHKALQPGDRVVMIGGRVGRDGIHGATFSSRSMDAEAPRSVVQIGSPFTQKRLADLLGEAAPAGLLAGLTDNGAGGLASSVGELAVLTGGARIDLARVPLKAAGLEPWEILLSESQERMTLAVRPDQLDALGRLAEKHAVEISDLGEFTASGRFEVLYGDVPVADLELEFLRHGWPRLTLPAVVATPPSMSWSADPSCPDPQELLLRLLASANVASRERLVRRHDHEVQARTVVKPYMQHAPQDAAVLQMRPDAWDGVAIASGIAPCYGDLDAWQSSACAFDEAVRSLVSVGVPLGGPGFLVACDNFCMPDVRFDAESNPDGPLKLGKLVRMAEALHEVAVGYGVPLVSGKDSMKNDRLDGKRRLSIPPTVLYTVVGRLADVRRAVTTAFQEPGDVVFLLDPGAEVDDLALGGRGLGASELSRLLGARGGAVPRLAWARAKSMYIAVGVAHARGWLVSSHDLSDGGLSVALSESALGGSVGARLVLPDREPVLAALFGEAPSRLLVSVRPEHAAALEATLGASALRLGEVGGERLVVQHAGEPVIDVAVAELRTAYEGGGLP